MPRSRVTVAGDSRERRKRAQRPEGQFEIVHVVRQKTGRDFALRRSIGEKNGEFFSKHGYECEYERSL